MPVVECSCRMVMSISGAKPRNTCIRCGSAEFRALEFIKQVAAAMVAASLAPIANCEAVFPMRLLATVGKAANPVGAFPL